MKRVLWMFVAVLLVFTASPKAYAEMTAFPAVRDYTAYWDVREDAWYYEYVKLCYEADLMSGTGNDLFCPTYNVSMQQGIAIIARLHQVFNGNPMIEDTTSGKTDWFFPYYDYCLHWQILDESEYLPTAVMTREMFVKLIMRVFPKTAFPKINEVESIPGYDTSTEIGQDVLVMYKSGVFSGRDKYGTFAPYTPISRAEIATLLCRIIRPDARVTVSLELASDDRVIAQAVPLDTNGLTITGFDGTYIYAGRSGGGAVQHSVFDLNGKQIIDWEKGYVNEASDGIFLVSDPVTGEVTYYNANGARLNQTSYYAGTDFSDGFAAVQDKDNTIHIIDINGNVVRTLNIFDFNIGGESLSGGYLQPTDRPNTLISIVTGDLVELPYSEISRFYNGIARVRRYGENGTFPANLIDTSLNELFLQDYTYIYWGDGYFPVTNGYSNWGVADAHGNLVVPMIYDSIQSNGYHMGLFSRLGSLTLCSISTGEVILELPTGKDTGYKLCDKFIIKSLSSHKADAEPNGQSVSRETYEISVFDFNGYKLLTLHNVTRYWSSKNGLIYSDGESLYYCNILESIQ